MLLVKKVPEYAVKLFRHGGSQAARLPKELRIDAAEAIGFRQGDVVVLRPVPARAWPKGYWSSFGPVGKDFVAPKPLPPSPHRDSALESL
jgi:antitoxin VapB